MFAHNTTLWATRKGCMLKVTHHVSTLSVTSDIFHCFFVGMI